MGKNFKRDNNGKHSKSAQIVKKNISRKDAEYNKKLKAHQRLQRKVSKDEKKKQAFEIRQMKKDRRSGLAERKIEAQKALDRKYGDTGEIWEDVDEHEKDIFDKDGYFDVPEGDDDIDAGDLAMLTKFANKGKGEAPAGEGQMLSDLIMAKLASGDFNTEDDL